MRVRCLGLRDPTPRTQKLQTGTFKKVGFKNSFQWGAELTLKSPETQASKTPDHTMRNPPVARVEQGLRNIFFGAIASDS